MNKIQFDELEKESGKKWEKRLKLTVILQCVIFQRIFSRKRKKLVGKKWMEKTLTSLIWLSIKVKSSSSFRPHARNFLMFASGSHSHNSFHVHQKMIRTFFFLHGNMHFEMPLTWLLLINFNHWSVLKEALFLSLFFFSHLLSYTLSWIVNNKKKSLKMVRLDFYLTMRWQRWSFPISCLLQSWIFFLLIFTLSAISNQHTIFPPFPLPYDALPPCQIGHLNEI